ncbi:Uncharacterised protein [uncultured archaeon]|nr:Uncharacterised protein [uncultured archaeon]
MWPDISRQEAKHTSSDATTDLQLDCELICKIMDDSDKECKMEAIE